MILILEPRNNSFADQTTRPLPSTTSITILRILPQQKRSLVLPPLHNPLQLLPSQNVPSHDKSLHARFAAGFPEGGFVS